MSFLTVSGISRQEREAILLTDIRFEQQEFQKIAVAGETGSGKSTLLKIIAGLVQPQAGSVHFEGERVKGPDEKLVAGHPGIAYLSQHFELAGSLRVEQVLRYANALPARQAEHIYAVCDIEHLMERRTDQLSGGEKQRIALARLLIGSPKLLLLDEPYSNLDQAHKSILKRVINNISDQLAISCIMVSHDPLDTLAWADEILILRAGQLQQKASPHQIYHQPANEYIAGLFGPYNLLPASLVPNKSNLQKSKKRLLIRPENIHLAEPAAGMLQGTVCRVNFYGSYHELEVRLKDSVLTVRTSANSFQKEEAVYLRLDTDKVWFV